MAKRKTKKRPRTRPRKARKKPRRASHKSAPGRRAIEAALAGVVHDIRTPLTGIVALAELLASSEVGARERAWAAAIKSGADHLAALTTLIVDAVKADAAGLDAAARTVLAAASGRSGRRRARRARRQQGHRGGNLDRARSAGDGGRRRAALARGAGKPRRQCGQIHPRRHGRLHRRRQAGGRQARASRLHRQRTAASASTRAR